MDPEAARTARESLDLAFHMSNILDTGLDRHTLSVLIALCDLGVNPEALAAVVKELRREKHSLSSSSSLPAAAPSSLSICGLVIRKSSSIADAMRAVATGWKWQLSNTTSLRALLPSMVIKASRTASSGRLDDLKKQLALLPEGEYQGPRTIVCVINAWCTVALGPRYLVYWRKYLMNE
ncbi:hypothetical protein RIF29_22384 [Crotalaria pallida]|uniref:Uncharacterized protein n=1 Tax=Crotalaria pallida TaxID=3830 RepID=A0AAN9IAB4_CROPI